MEHEPIIHRAWASNVKSDEGGQQHEKSQSRLEQLRVDGQPAFVRRSDLIEGLNGSLHDFKPIAEAGRPVTRSGAASRANRDWKKRLRSARRTRLKLHPSANERAPTRTWAVAMSAALLDQIVAAPKRT